MSYVVHIIYIGYDSSILTIRAVNADTNATASTIQSTPQTSRPTPAPIHHDRQTGQCTSVTAHSHFIRRMTKFRNQPNTYSSATMKAAETAVRTLNMKLKTSIMLVFIIQLLNFSVPLVVDILLDCEVVEHIQYVRP